MPRSIQSVQKKWRNLVISCGWMDYFLYCCVAYNRAYNVTLSLHSAEAGWDILVGFLLYNYYNYYFCLYLVFLVSFL